MATRPPAAFTAPFTERVSYGPVKSTTTGTLLYSAQSPYGAAERLERASGEADRYCGGAKLLRATPCTHLAANGTRYLLFPDLGECCTCCTAADGCGPTKQDWAKNASFANNATVDVGGASVDAFKWTIKGLQENDVYTPAAATGAEQPPLRVYQSPDDDMVFGEAQIGAVDPSHFWLPAGGCSAQCGGVCALVGRRAEALRSAGRAEEAAASAAASSSAAAAVYK